LQGLYVSKESNERKVTEKQFYLSWPTLFARTARYSVNLVKPSIKTSYESAGHLFDISDHGVKSCL